MVSWPNRTLGILGVEVTVTASGIQVLKVWRQVFCFVLILFVAYHPNPGSLHFVAFCLDVRTLTFLPTHGLSIKPLKVSHFWGAESNRVQLTEPPKSPPNQLDASEVELPTARTARRGRPRPQRNGFEGAAACTGEPLGASKRRWHDESGKSGKSCAKRPAHLLVSLSLQTIFRRGPKR